MSSRVTLPRFTSDVDLFMKLNLAEVFSGAKFLKFKWAGLRICFFTCAGFSLFTGVCGLLTYPFITYFVLNDLRFWRHLKLGARLLIFGWRGLYMVARGENNGFLFSVPLTSPPLAKPDPRMVKLNPDWVHGGSCGECSLCCDAIHCPLVDTKKGGCRGYQSLYWRYFNCGRFPTSRSSLEYYNCPKWVIK